MNVVLGVTGSVAAYRAADLARELMRAGATVRVLLTESAERFVTRALFEALTGGPVLVGAFEEPEPGKMAHIEWARWADLVLVAPATAHTINRLAAGVADDMLTTVALATTRPLLLAPAMNPEMWANAATVAAVETLRGRGIEIVEPSEGDVACGEYGQGKLASIAEIVAAAVDAGVSGELLAGRTILITTGPTEEPLDAVRHLTNRSSGKMGAALARAALRIGARVRVVAGPQRAALPVAAEVVRVRTAEEMLSAALPLAHGADLIIGAAAVADYRPGVVAPGKLRRSSEPMTLELVPNPDVIAALAAANPSARTIGFAAEPSADLAEARAKLARKGLWGIAHNDVSAAGIGFDSHHNALTLITAQGEWSSGVRTKLGCAAWLLERSGA